jgi:hypothetical protein
MHQIPTTIANDWAAHPELLHSVPWLTASGLECVTFEAHIDVSHWSTRLNDFPAEPLYSLLINGDEVMHFDDWPTHWNQPAFPTNA